jgi:thiol-disulfide isomerase/thioredoxin
MCWPAWVNSSFYLFNYFFMGLFFSVRGMVCAIFLGIGVCFGQARPLALGDRLPDVALGKLRVSDYGDRLLILDFWSTACGTCIEEMPRVAALQKRYTGRMMVVDVDFEAGSRVGAFYGRRPDLAALGTPVVTSDTVLRKLFPHRFEPHLVWIDHGIYVAATEGDYLTERNIDSVLLAGKAGLRQKVDPADVDMKFPLSSYSKGTVYGCTLTGFLKDLPPKVGLVRDTAAGTLRYYLVNQGILHMYDYVLGSGLPMTANRRLLLVKDSSNYINSGKEYQDAWDEQHTYSFESVVPLGTDEGLILGQLKQVMEMDLGVRGGIEHLETDVYALRKIGDGPALSLYNRKQTNLNPAAHSFLHHVDAAYLVDLMNAPAGMLPVVDETRGTVFFDLALGVLPKNISEWTAVLRGHGLELVRCRRALDMFVLRENSSKNNLQSTLKPKS